MLCSACIIISGKQKTYRRHDFDFQQFYTVIVLIKTIDAKSSIISGALR